MQKKKKETKINKCNKAKKEHVSHRFTWENGHSNTSAYFVNICINMLVIHYTVTSDYFYNMLPSLLGTEDETKRNEPELTDAVTAVGK